MSWQHHANTVPTHTLDYNTHTNNHTDAKTYAHTQSQTHTITHLQNATHTQNTNIHAKHNHTYKHVNIYCKHKQIISTNINTKT